MKKIKVLSLFDGLSGARVALDRAKIRVDNYYASEVDRWAQQVSKKNYPDIVRLGDIKNIKGINLPQIDLLIAGFPCSDLSVAKKDRQGLAGAQSGLFYEAVRLLKECRPRYFLMENVNSMSKADKQTITEILGVEPIMINSALLSAQNRKRLYWFGRLVGDKYETVEVSQPEDKSIYLKDILEENVDEKYFIKNINELNWITDSKRIKKKYTQFNGDKSLCLLARTYVKNKSIRVGQIDGGGQGNRIYSPEGKSVNLSANGGGRGAKTGLYCVAQRGRYNKDGSTSQKLEPRFDDKTNTLTNVQKDNYVADKSNIRKLTPVETERLQTIPDNYTALGINNTGEEVNISNSQRYKMVGNGFTSDVIAYILSFAKW